MLEDRGGCLDIGQAETGRGESAGSMVVDYRHATSLAVMSTSPIIPPPTSSSRLILLSASTLQAHVMDWFRKWETAGTYPPKLFFNSSP